MRRIHGVSKRVLQDIWRFGQGVDVARLFKDFDRFSLYESPTGLVYFHPMVIGDESFYRTYYDKWHVHEGLTKYSESRADYMETARHVRPGAKLIDVGCGPGIFRRHIPHAQYHGLDPYAETNGDPAIFRETLEHHSQTHEGVYDVATAFHVIEHVPDPRNHAALMVRLLKPGGLLVLAAPLHPSPLTEIPNFPLNMPPHHVTWWNPRAFSALAEELALEVVEAKTLRPSPHQGKILWLHRLLYRKAGQPPKERYYAHRWSWHASLALAVALGWTAEWFRRLPRDAQPVDAYLVARKRS